LWLDRRHALAWLLVGLTFLINYIAIVRFQSFFSPDSQHYLAMAYLFGGDSPMVARDKTVEFAANYNIEVAPVDSLLGWGLVQPRVVLPLLAAPFVHFFGPLGFAVVTALITVALIATLTVLLGRRYGWPTAVATMLIVNASFYLMSYFTAMLTESLSALWTTVTLIAAWRWMKTRSVWWLVVAGAATVASAFTRQATLIVAGAFLVAWVLGSLIERRNSPWMWPALVVTGASFASQIFQSVVFPTFSQLDQFLRMTGTDSLGAAIAEVPRLAWKIIWEDLTLLQRYDLPLLFLIVLSLIGMVIFWRREESHLLLGAILATSLYNITNGTPTQFRYAVPGIVFFVIVAAMVIRRAGETLPPALARTAAPADQAPEPELLLDESTSTTRSAARPSP